MAEKGPHYGDLVEITTDKKTYTGILIKSPELLESDSQIIKLESGYNIGIKTSNIQSIKVIEKRKESTSLKSNKEKAESALPTVTLISYGGTISSKIDYATGGVSADFTADDFKQMIPKLRTVANIKTLSLNKVMSEDMNAADWVTLAQAVHKELKTSDGIVVTQGTDTLHYTSAALSYMLQDLSKPVVLTAAQKSIDRGSSDAFMNLFCAITTAAQSDIAQVVTCMHAHSDDDVCNIIRGTKVRKMHTTRRDAFKAINETPFATVTENGTITIINNTYSKKDPARKTKLIDAIQEKVALIFAHPNMDPKIIEFHIKQGVKGIVIAATGLGHVPTTRKEYSLLPYLKKAQEHQIPVIIAAQTIHGAVNPYVYSNERVLSIGHGCIYVKDLPVESAYVKLCWALGQTQDYKKVKELILTNHTGEYNESIMLGDL